MINKEEIKRVMASILALLLFVLTMVVHDLLCPNVRELTYSLSNRKIENPEANAPGFCHALIS